MSCLAAGIASAGSIACLYAQTASADLVLYNGKIVTVDDAFSIREAVAIKDGRIVAVGANEPARRSVVSMATSVTAGGRGGLRVRASVLSAGGRQCDDCPGWGHDA